MDPYKTSTRSLDPRMVLPTLGLLPVIAISAVVAQPVAAQDAVALDTLVVEDSAKSSSNSYSVDQRSSGKATASILDAPKSVSVVTERQIQERAATSLSDILMTTPGITIRAGEGGVQAGDNIYIRGFDASTETLVDGVRNASRTSYEAFNLDSVEIIRGSDGTETGAGSEGGSVNLITKTPKPGSFDTVGLSYGTGNFKRFTLDTNRQFGDLGARLNLMYQDADDFGGKKGKTSKRFGIAPSVSYRLDEVSKLTAGLYYYKNEDMPDYGVRMSGTSTAPEYSVGSGTSADPYEPIDVPVDTFYGTPGRDFTNNQQAVGYLRYDRKLSSGLDFAATLRGTNDRTQYLATQPGTSATGVTRGYKAANRKNKTTAFNAQLSGTTSVFGLENRFAIGLDYSKSKQAIRQGLGYTFSPAPGEVAYVDPDLGHWDGTITLNPYASWVTTKQTSVYALDTVRIAPQWDASFGLNYTSYDVTSESATADPVSKKSDLVNGSFGIVFKPAENGRIYASVASASNPVGLGSTPADGSASASGTNLDPEESTSYEIGTKWSFFDDNLLVSANLFQIDKKNMRVRSDDGVNFDNIGKSRSKGVELGVAGQITEKWGITAGYVYQDVRSIDGGFTTGGATVATDGKQIAKIPRNSFSVWSTYAATEQVLVGGGATYYDQRVAAYSGTTGDTTAILPSSWRFDLMAAYTLTADTSLQLNVNNIFDEKIYGDSHSTQHVYVEPGRNVVLTLKHTF